MDVQPTVDGNKSRRLTRRAVAAAGIFVLLAILLWWLRSPSDPDDVTRVDGSVGCGEVVWFGVGGIIFVIAVVAGTALLVWGGVREARRRDRTGLVLMLAGVIGLALAWSARDFAIAVNEVSFYSCD